jgi:flagellar hook-associated protein FlgK
MPDILGIGSSGVSAYRRLLETVGSNIVNANTEGYKRRAVSLEATGTGTMLPTGMTTVAGSGVLVDKVSRASDQFLEQQYYRSNSNFQRAQALSTGLKRLENALFTSENNLNTAAQGFFDRASDLANDPTSKPARFAFMDSGERLVDEFHRVHYSVESESKAADEAIATTVRLTNTLTSQIGDLNRELERRYTNGQPANDLLDQRDKILSDLSEVVDFTIVPAETGAVTLYLGDAATGAPLVDRLKARPLGVDTSGDQVTLILDPYSAPTPTSRLSGGVLQGLIDLKEELNGVRDVLDRLALGIASAANERHQQGVDMNGRPGKPLFSSESLSPIPSPTNTGEATLSIGIEKDAVLNGAKYSAIYNATTQLWTVRSELTQERATGASQVTIDGLTFRFTGAPKDGDSFIAEPLKNAAGSIRFLRDDVTEIATGLAVYVDGSPQNAQSSELAVVKTGEMTDKPPIPSLGELLANAPSNQLSFRRDGVAYALLTGSTNTSFVSLGELSALSFSLDASEIKSRDQAGASQPVRLSFELDARTLNEQDITLDLTDFSSDLQSIADEINRVTELNGYESQFFASVASGTITINALGTYTISSGMLQGFDYDGAPKTFTPVEQRRISGGEIALFTTEGRQLTGSEYTERQAAALLTSANGFSTQAKYLPPASTQDYRGLGLQALSSPLLVGADADGQTQVVVNAFPEYDSPLATGDATRPAGTVYALNVAGLKSVRLAGDAIAGKDDIDIAALMTDRLHAQAAERRWQGGLFDIAQLPLSSMFEMTVDGVDHEVTFRRDTDVSGNLLTTGSFEASSLPGLQFALKQEGGLQRVEISGLRRMSQVAPTIGFNGVAASDLCLRPGLVTTTIIAQKPSTPPGPNDPPIVLHVATSASEMDLTINGLSGSSADGSIQWAFDSDGRLRLTSLDEGLVFTSKTAAQRDHAVALGFIGTDRTITRDGAKISIKTAIADEKGDLADASDSVSRVASSIRFDQGLPEDIIVAVKGDIAGQRVLASNVLEPAVRIQPRAPDLKIRILNSGDEGMIEIYDAKSNSSIAHRAWRPGDTVTYQDMSFRLNTAARMDDQFTIVRDQVRELDNRNALLLSSLRNAMLLDRYGGSFQDAYALAAAEFGANAESSVITTSNNKRATTELKSVLEGKTGVNLDNEASDLIRFQQAYQAAAQVVSVARDMFQTILKTF